MVSIKMHMFAMEKAFWRLISYDCKNVVLPSLQQPLLCKKAQHGAEAAQGGKKNQNQTKNSSRNGAACRAKPSLPRVPTGRERVSARSSEPSAPQTPSPARGAEPGCSCAGSHRRCGAAAAWRRWDGQKAFSLLGKSERESGSSPHARSEGPFGSRGRSRARMREGVREAELGRLPLFSPPGRLGPRHGPAWR